MIVNPSLQHLHETKRVVRPAEVQLILKHLTTCLCWLSQNSRNVRTPLGFAFPIGILGLQYAYTPFGVHLEGKVEEAQPHLVKRYLEHIQE